MGWLGIGRVLDPERKLCGSTNKLTDTLPRAQLNSYTKPKIKKSKAVCGLNPSLNTVALIN